MNKAKSLSLLFLFSFFFTCTASACPDIDGLVDVNCDEELNIVCFGDSITYGRGDTGNSGGYPLRLQALYPHAVIYNLGKPGESTYSGRSRARTAFANLPDADYFVILEGVNDYFISGHSTAETKQNLLSMVRNGASYGGIALLSNLTDIRRTKQRSWVLAVNNQINPYRQIDLFSLGKGIISSDLLHPSAAGYDAMTTVISAALQSYSEANRPVDSDQDGLYDYEEPLYGTNVYVADTDGDGLTDGSEIHVYHSNPHSLDSDGDGFGDYQEAITMHSNPASARPGAPVLKTLTVLPPSE